MALAVRGARSPSVFSSWGGSVRFFAILSAISNDPIS